MKDSPEARSAGGTSPSPKAEMQGGEMAEALQSLVNGWQEYEAKSMSTRSEGQADAYYILAKNLRPQWETAVRALLSAPKDNASRDDVLEALRDLVAAIQRDDQAWLCMQETPEMDAAFAVLKEKPHD